ncbi:hypothetical protein [Mycobacterium paragordonae]|uniref:hypothetical protein n=1 Tax=Mycobacterium paragordonae TaxID=1389713 RepID=UPI0012E2AC21|nr:hypothetical protein [Mycobacterium paragordonae]
MTAPAVAPPAAPAVVWKALAHLIAARPTVRLCSPDTAKFDRTAALTTRLPRYPAAVPLYLRGRTHYLVLDFDTKHHGQHTVDADFTRALRWITECGGVVISDRSTSGGRHLLVPLAVGTTATAEELRPLLRLLEARLPSLDKTPMTNPKTGCITVPGSPCREGGHRILDGPLDAALHILTRRSHPALLPRLNVLLGALSASTPLTPVRTSSSASGAALTGSGEDTRLRPDYTRTGDLPARITAYATTGVLPSDTTWRSHSEARQSVLAHAVLHGYTLSTIRALIAPGRPWNSGLARAYARYQHTAETALRRDFAKALQWATDNAQFFRPTGAQEIKLHTRGGTQGPLLHRRWLTNAVAWVEQQYPAHPYRWIGAAVYQALAVHAVRSGEVINGVPVVGVGGRSLSIATGLLSETVVWQFLRETRDQPGSPLVRSRVAQGRRPDVYALTQQHCLDRAPEAIAAARIEDVHLAWKVIGHRHRRIYELIIHRELANPRDVFAAAHVSPSTGYATLGALATAGLIARRRGHLGPGTLTLDQISAAHQLKALRAERISRHRRQRQSWHDWLTLREEMRNPPDDIGDTAPVRVIADPGDRHRQEYLSAVLTTGPPALDDERHALELLAELVGARILARHGSAGPS